MTKLTHILLPWLTASLLLCTATASADTQLLDKVIVVLDEGVVLKSEFDARKESVLERVQGQQQMPPMEVLDQQILDQLILEQLQIEEAKRYGMEVSEQQLNQALNTIAANNNFSSLEAFAADLSQQGMSLAELRQQISRDLLINQVQQAIVNNRIRITDQEIDNFLDSSDGKLATSPDYRLGHILISVPGSATEEAVAEAKQKAEDIHRQLQEGADFATTAIAYSNDQTALEGGDLGWRKLNQLPELFADVVNELEVGEVSAPVRSGAGFHLLKNMEQRGGGAEWVDQTRARHILIKESEIMDAETAQEQLTELRKQIEEGADFATLARENSEDIGSMLQGGDLGWSTPGMFVPAFEEAMAETDIGEVAGPFKSQFGWHILQVTDRREEDMSDVVIRNRAAQMLRDRRFDEELQVWQQELREDAFIDIKEFDR